MSPDLLVEAFFQASTVKGHRYLDDAGKIMNRWDAHFPEKSVGLDGLIMANADSVFRGLRVDTRTIWIHCSLPDSLNRVVSLAHDTTAEIAKIIEVDQFRRIGLRLQYVYGVQNLENAAQQMAENLFSTSWCNMTDPSFLSRSGFEFMVPLGTEELAANLRVGVVKRDPKVKVKEKIPETGIMIDLDIIRSQITDIRDLKGILGKAKSLVEDKLPTIRDNVLQGVNIV